MQRSYWESVTKLHKLDSAQIQCNPSAACHTKRVDICFRIAPGIRMYIIVKLDTVDSWCLFHRVHCLRQSV